MKKTDCQGEKKNTPLLPDAAERSQRGQEVENIFNNSTYHMDLSGEIKQTATTK